MHSNPTLRQKIVMKAIDDWIRINGRSPTFRELALSLQVKSVRTVTKHCHALRKKLMIENIPKEARTLSLTEKGTKVLDVFRKTEEARSAPILQIKAAA